MLCCSGSVIMINWGKGAKLTEKARFPENKAHTQAKGRKL